MKINTKYFGEIEVREDEIINFPFGLYGFEDIRQYVIIRFDNNDDSLLSLQPIENPELAFVLFNPFAIICDYAPVATAADLSDVGADEGEGLFYYVIAVVDDDFRKTVVNLKSPLIVNPNTRLAKQIILENTEYSIRHRVFPSLEKGEF